MNSKELMNVRQEAVEKFRLQQTIMKRLSEVDSGVDIISSTTSEQDRLTREECVRHIHPYDTEIAAGQVRMLSGTERPTYVLVARRWDELSWLILPFSNYSEPATETEIKIRDEDGIRPCVLQLWNARSLLEQTLAKSWLVHTLSDAELEDAVSAWKWSVGVGELSADQLARTGTPIMRRDDSRIAYEDSELANFAKLDTKDLIATEHLAWLDSVHEVLRGMKMAPFTQSRVFERVYALAAAEAEQPVMANCRIPEFDGVVNVRYTPHDRHLYIRVFGADGKPSQKLDGWDVLGSDACLLGTISNAGFVCEFEAAFDGVLCIAYEEGDVVHLLGSDNGV